MKFLFTLLFLFTLFGQLKAQEALEKIDTYLFENLIKDPKVAAQMEHFHLHLDSNYNTDNFNFQSFIDTHLEQLKDKTNSELLDIKWKLTQFLQEYYFEQKQSLLHYLLCKESIVQNELLLEKSIKELQDIHSPNSKFSKRFYNKQQDEIDQLRKQLIIDKERVAQLKQKLNSSEELVLSIGHDPSDFHDTLDLFKLKEMAMTHRLDLKIMLSKLDEMIQEGIKKKWWTVTKNFEISPNFIYNEVLLELTSRPFGLSWKDPERVQSLCRLKELEKLIALKINHTIYMIDENFARYVKAKDQLNSKTSSFVEIYKEYLLSKLTLEAEVGIHSL